MNNRYTNEEQIISAIDKCHLKAQQLSKSAEQLDIIADNLFKYPGEVEDAKLKRLEAAKMRGRVNNLVNKKAKNLGAKLSEFRTAVIPCVTDDTSVSTKLK